MQVARPKAGGFTKREQALLDALVESGGRFMGEVELLSDVWGWDNAEQIRTKAVPMCVSRTRAKVAGLGLDPSCIVTERGRGYAYDAGLDEGGRVGALRAS